MVLSDDELIDELRREFSAATAGLHPRAGTLKQVRGQIADLSAHKPADSQRANPARGQLPRLRLSPSTGVLSGALGAAVTIAVVVIAVLSLHGASHDDDVAPGSAQSPPLAVGRSQIVARSADPARREGWTLRETRTGQRSACLRLGRIQSRHFTALPDSQDGGHCAQTDATGHLLLNLQDVNALLPGTGWRSLYYGVLGPDTISITYRARSGHAMTVPTGPDGAYLIVEHATCPHNYLEGNACAIGGTSRSRVLAAGVITKVTYRNGATCQLRYVRPGEHAPGANTCANTPSSR